MRQILRITLLASAAVIAAPAFLLAQEPKPPADLKKVAVADGVELHYVEKGNGDPIVLIHGGIQDYSMWENQLGPFAEKYRVVAYSRRYNYPNKNKLQPNYSPVVDAEDLAILIRKLDLGKVHVVGSSLGGRVALFFAEKHPELVRSLILQELPVHFKGDPLDDSFEKSLKAARVALEKGKPGEAIQAALSVPSGGQFQFDKVPGFVQERQLRNVQELEAMANSGVVSEIDRDAVRKITVPTLLMSGEKSAPFFKPIEKELLRLLPEKSRQHVVISGAAHPKFRTHPEQCNKAMLEFLRGK